MPQATLFPSAIRFGAGVRWFTDLWLPDWVIRSVRSRAVVFAFRLGRVARTPSTATKRTSTCWLNVLHAFEPPGIQAPGMPFYWRPSYGVRFWRFHIFSDKTQAFLLVAGAVGWSVHAGRGLAGWRDAGKT
jgi:hypothetical protein